MNAKKKKELGERTLAAIGLPLDGHRTVEALGETVIVMANWATSINDRQSHKRLKEQQAEMEKIAKAAESLAARLAQVLKSIDEDRSSWIKSTGGEYSAARLEDVARRLNLNAALLLPHAGWEPLVPIENLERLIGYELVNQFRCLFGDKARKYTLDPVTLKWDGPFIRFARSVLDQAGIELSDAAIVQYVKRLKKNPPKLPDFGPGPKGTKT